MMKQGDLFGTKPKAPYLKRMTVIDAGEVHGVNSVRYQCFCCNLETSWMVEKTITKAKRGIPCLQCNQDKLRILHLNLKEQWWNEINSGIKTLEYRLRNQYWFKRLVGKQYDFVFVKLGYPSKTQIDRIIVFVWNGYFPMIVKHPEFDGKQEVYAIDLTERVWGI
ncbi:hypothetical protein [Hydrogenovibrio marinus]|uniref:Uncharacterized protein n=1 Tax=Hydrogenovibrio marinus TaxID=28885 RepID=A0A066ZLZ2_HYDMR|nr:hypothetical protein [Hydrogenovibrio marinus]KDN94828.1 hypothetical protein EI16_00495 [Hydrogenovibrio marinus]BBN59287.1 hypothetical protein HVMH_0881 [Hydrogenovibrio marinus]